MRANVHGLLHLPDTVRHLGPLWAHSCFPFESANGELLRLFHGSQGVEKQVSACIHACIDCCALLLRWRSCYIKTTSM